MTSVPEWPSQPEALARAIGEAHRRYTRRVNFREGWRGHLWQERFFSCVLERRHALAAARYVERNPVRAGLVKRAWEWPWSSAAAHVAGRGDVLIAPGGPLAAEIKNWRRFLLEPDDAETLDLLRRHGRTGRPLASERLVRMLEHRLGRRLSPGRPGRPRKDRGK